MPLAIAVDPAQRVRYSVFTGADAKSLSAFQGLDLSGRHHPGPVSAGQTDRPAPVDARRGAP